MASVKVKFRPSTIPGREGTIYYQIIHHRTPRQLITDYHIFPSEWDENTGEPIRSSNTNRSSLLKHIRERIRWDKDRLNKIILHLDKEGLSYTSDTIIEEFNKTSANDSLFIYMQAAIERLKNNVKTRTSETYKATLRSFKTFRKNQDIYISSLL